MDFMEISIIFSSLSPVDKIISISNLKFMLLSRIKNLFKRRKNQAFPNDQEAENTLFINCWTAGIRFDNRLKNLLECRIKDPIVLVREPNNPVDGNAIHVKTTCGKSLGFVEKQIAKRIAPEMDSGRMVATARIINIKSNINNKNYGVKIAIPVSLEIYDSLKSDDHKEISFEFNYSPNGNLYLLLDCEELVLSEVAHAIERAGIVVIRSGVSFSSSSSGKSYRWYIRLENDASKTGIEKVLRKKFPLLDVQDELEITNLYIEYQEEEIQELKEQFQKVLTQNDSLLKTIERYERRNTAFENQFEKMLDTFLPSVTFVRDSTDILKREVLDYTIALTKIQQHYLDPQKKAKKVQTLDKWFECHYSTGQNDDGRIYFRRRNNEMHVLVSFKKSQKHDILFLGRI